jgi:hypothetical protein
MNSFSDQPIDGEILLFGEKPIIQEKPVTFFYQFKSSIDDEDRKNKYLTCGDFLELPCADKSLRSLTIRGGLERLERKYLYMILSEARRTIILGGTLHISAYDLRRPFQVFSPPLTKIFHMNPFNLHHFISPEDWEIIREEKRNSLFITYQQMALKRIDGILPEIGDLDFSAEDLPVS